MDMLPNDPCSIVIITELLPIFNPFLGMIFSGFFSNAPAGSTVMKVCCYMYALALDHGEIVQLGVRDDFQVLLIAQMKQRCKNIRWVNKNYEKNIEIYLRYFTGRAVDPHSFFADPDPAVFLYADPGPA